MHIEVSGHGAPLVLLHGWGMHGGVWGDVLAQLAQSFTVHTVDLPGHGYSKNIGWVERSDTHRLNTKIDGYRYAQPILQAVVDELSACFAKPITVCGWSLGGQVALHWALREPAKINKLIVVASTPCFSAREDWPCGMPREVLEKFAAELEQDHAATLRRFIALQLRGSENERALLAQMRAQLFSRGKPDRDALRAGLDILRDVDQRGELAEIRQQTLVIAGQRDKLTPPGASNYLAHAMPNARLVEIAGAAHVPFLSHPEQFVETVKGFLNAKDN